jgi:hypothetical protein
MVPSPRASGERVRERGNLLSPTLSSTSVWRRGRWNDAPSAAAA